MFQLDLSALNWSEWWQVIVNTLASLSTPLAAFIGISLFFTFASMFRDFLARRREERNGGGAWW